ncbi:hypothetical protein [Acidianus sp. RZ1]|uniref:hypothetical protein n=1 Tax=Acidianus sp. RZ1 TaxID=1540082 RepID=UPI001490A4B7|nr:hypothetical protein [Acidianus sp. RZ1]NON61298.1 hypothetical protein [Acidianus sp. RZ1]
MREFVKGVKFGRIVEKRRELLKDIVTRISSKTDVNFVSSILTRRFRGKLELPLAYKFILEKLNLLIKEKTMIIADEGLNKLSEYHRLLLLTGALNQYDRSPSPDINKNLIFPVIFLLRF